MQHLRMEWTEPKFKVLGIWFTNDLDNCEQNNYSEKFAELKIFNWEYGWKGLAELQF